MALPVLVIVGGAFHEPAGALQGTSEVPLLVLVILGQVLECHYYAASGQMLPDFHSQTPLTAAACEPSQLQLAFGIETPAVPLQVREGRRVTTVTRIMSSAGEHVGIGGRGIVVAAL